MESEDSMNKKQASCVEHYIWIDYIDKNGDPQIDTVVVTADKNADTEELKNFISKNKITKLETFGCCAKAPWATGKGADSSNSEAAPVTESMGPEELDEGAVEPENDDNMDEDKFASETSGLKAVIANLKKKLAQERNDRQIERKARRGLAIAKQLVAENKLEDSYDAIKIKIAEIVKLEDSEIDRLERKVAGTGLYK